MSATGSEEGILSNLLKNLVQAEKEGTDDDDNTDTDRCSSRPAKKLEECIVGPNANERMKGRPYWGHGCLPGNRKRKRKSEDAAEFIHGKSHSNSNSNGGDDDKSPADSSTFLTAMKTFLSSGCCVIPDVLPKDFVERSREKVSSDLKYLQTELQNRKREAMEQHNEHLLAQVARGDFRELVDRDGGRRDVRFQLDRFPFTSPGLIYNPIVYPLVRELLGGGDVNLLYAGIMWAMPLELSLDPKNCTSSSSGSGSNGNDGDKSQSTNNPEENEELLRRMDTESQKWHGDGGHLFDHTHLPPHCINVFYPLVDLSKFNGPTEVMPGTHQLGKFGNDHPTTAGQLKKFGLNCNRGDVLLFDYRLKHRGGANFTTEPRPILYLAYAKPFFRDAGNSRSGHSLIRSSTSTTGRPSPPWVARILSGDPAPMGHFEDGRDLDLDLGHDQNNGTNNHVQCNDNEKNSTTSICTHDDGGETAEPGFGSGERWILFKMNVELPGCKDPKVITVHHGDVALEISARFCRENGLGEEFVPVLGESIQSQMDAAAAHILK